LIAKVERGDDCWHWTGATTSSGYGRLAVNDPGQPKRLEQAHRVAYELAYGPIPTGLVVRHRCDVPACCRPSHLELGTQADNVQDMVDRGRARGGSSPGIAHPRSKLTEDEVRQIRAAYSAGDTYKAIGTRFGLGISQVARIVKRTAWAHVLDLPAGGPHD
jgi:hypothetical protein